MHSPFFLGSFAWMENWFWLLLCGAVAVPIFVIIYGAYVVREAGTWLKDILIPVMTSLVVALVGIGFAIDSGRRQRTETESDRQTSLMRELMISQDRRDTAYLLSLDLALNIHLNRYIDLKKETPERNTGFEEEAAFFFYSKHRAALVNLRSTEGNLAFHRLWMENAFEQLAIHVVECVLGGVSEKDPSVSAEGESATYKLFGARVHTASEANDAEKWLGGHAMVLADFDALIHDRSRSFVPQDEDVKRIKAEFTGFQDRLHNGDKKPPTVPYINKEELIKSLLAMQGLVAYSYHNLFAVWYNLSTKEIPTHVKDLPTEKAPELFLESAWHDFKPSPPAGFTGDWEEQRKKDWQEKRLEAWKLVLKFCPKEV